MAHPFTVNIDAWEHGSAIPARFAFGRPGDGAPFAPSDNVSPAISWSDAPAGKRSSAILCSDPDAPSSVEDVNQKGRTVPAELPRITFFHWALVDIPVGLSGLEEGAASRGITPKGKEVGQTHHGLTGKNDYTGWFKGDPEMEVDTYGSYDGPCPPWNDSIVHHYHFEVFALDVETLGLQGAFSGQDALEAMKGHVLARASHMGTYTMIPEIRGVQSHPAARCG
jgi:Raf kinase inhibitor-like YbhB/YbcL family protein